MRVRGSAVRPTHDLLMLVFEAWVRDELRWILQGRRSRSGGVRWTTVNDYAPSSFWRIAHKYMAERGDPFLLIFTVGPDDQDKWPYYLSRF